VTPGANADAALLPIEAADAATTHIVEIRFIMRTKKK